MLDDLSKTIKAQLYERASSPLFGAFVLSWLAWNYRFVLAIISSLPVPEKIEYIDANLFPTYQHVWLQGLIYPLLTTIFLIFVYPIPAKWVYEYWRKRQRELKEIQQRIDDETPLTKEEARQLRREALRASGEYEQEIERRSIEVARLKELVADLEGRLATPNQEPVAETNAPSSDIESSLDDEQLKMLQTIANSPTPQLQKSLIANSGPDRIRAEYNFGELERRNFISTNYSTQYRDHLVKATHAGRSYLVNNQVNEKLA